MNLQLKYLLWFPAIFMMLVIFYFSSKESDSSSELSSDVTITIIDISSKLANIEMTMEEKEAKAVDLEIYIRKAAHFFEYTILSICYLIALSSIYNMKNRKLYIMAFVFTVLYACTDEFHQLFVPGRTGKITDVFIDSCGGIFGLLIYAGLLEYGQKFMYTKANIRKR